MLKDGYVEMEQGTDYGSGEVRVFCSGCEDWSAPWEGEAKARRAFDAHRSEVHAVVAA